MTTAPLVDLPGFRILSHAGQGGLGDVFVAERLSTGGQVAIKLLRATDNAADMERRIRREVAALLALKGHPGVIQIEEVITTRKGPALVMEYAGEGSLHSILQQCGTLDASDTADVGVQVAQLLSDAHALGIVHRDIKPHNILRTGFGRYKVCDFGIAALTKTPGWADHTSAISYRYASPEELDGTDVDGASDVYSLGVTLVQARVGTTDGLRTGSAMSFASSSQHDRTLAETLHAMTQPNPQARPTASQVVGMLHAIAPQAHTNHLAGAAAAVDETIRRHPRPAGGPSQGSSASPPPDISHPLPRPTTNNHWWE